MSDARKKKSGVLVWGVMGLLVLGLGGFGLAGAFRTAGGSVVATVGGQEITANRFLSAFQQDMNRASKQSGSQITVAEAQLAGVDQQSLRRQVALAALANEAKRIELSVGDKAVRDALLATPAFQAGGGVFSAATYDLVLRQQHLKRPEYESLLRADKTQQIVRNTVSSAVPPQNTAARVLMNFLGETRALTWAEITPAILPAPLQKVDEASARAYYDATPGPFTIPETRHLTYALLSPALLAKNIDVPEADIRALFDTRKDQLDTPARRVISRIIFANMDEAKAAMARISSGDASFDTIATERGLTSKETNIGVVRATQLSTEAAALLFASENTGAYGPVKAELGPAIFKVNASLPAKIVPFADVKDQLKTEIALGQAKTAIPAKISDIQDRLAGGAALEDLAKETDMVLRTFDLNANTKADLAMDPVFFTEANAASVGEERDLVELPDGGVVVVRVDAIDPAKVQPYDTVAAEANKAATTAANIKSAIAYADELKAQVSAGADLAATLTAAGGSAHVESGITRTAPPAGLPPSVGLDLFKLDAGKTGTFPSATGAYIVHIDSVTPFDPTTDTSKNQLAKIEAKIKSDISNTLFLLYANGIVATSDVKINQGMIDQILASIPQ